MACSQVTAPRLYSQNPSYDREGGVDKETGGKTDRFEGHSPSRGEAIFIFGRACFEIVLMV